jgi:hypothetical protein
MNLKNLIAFFALLLLFNACEDTATENTYSDGGALKIADPFLQINTPVVAFQAGIKDYTLDMNAVNGTNTLTKVNVYSVFTDAKTGKKSEPTLFASYDVPAGNKASLVKTFTYADLKKGVTVNGAGLPDEKDLAVGSGWKFSFEGETSTGKAQLGGTINVGVLSRFAGIYKIVDFKYFRIGVPTALAQYAIGNERFIGSVDENTFSYNDYWGGFAWPGKSFNLDIDFATNKVNVPILVDGNLFSGNRELNCNKDAADMKFVPCDGSNVFTIDDVTGKHRIKMSYGYFTDGSGPREFYEELEKVVK